MQKSIFNKWGVILLILASVSCESNKEPIEKSIYTIWVGSAAFALGYSVDSFTRKNGLTAFVNLRSGKQLYVPNCQIFKIEVN